MNNQFDPNNMNNWQQQQQNFQRMQQQFKQQNTTSPGIRFGITTIIGFLPQLFLEIFGTTKDLPAAEQPLTYGVLWAIGLSLIIVGGILVFILTKLSPDIKSDVIIPTAAISAAMLSFTVFLNIPSQNLTKGDNPGAWMYIVAIMMAFVFYFVAAILTWVVLFIGMISKVKKQFTNGENPFQNMFKPNMGPNPNQQPQAPKRPKSKKQLDDDLKNQGIDVDALDLEFGTHFEPEDAQDVKGKMKPTKDDSTSNDQEENK